MEKDPCISVPNQKTKANMGLHWNPSPSPRSTNYRHANIKHGFPIIEVNMVMLLVIAIHATCLLAPLAYSGFVRPQQLANRLHRSRCECSLMAAPPPLLDSLALKAVEPRIDCMVDELITRRLRCLSRMIGVTDLTTAASLNFAGKVSALRSLIEKYNIGEWFAKDVPCLVAWHGHHSKDTQLSLDEKEIRSINN